LKVNITFEITGWAERVVVALALVYRRIRYGYAFRRIPLTRGKFAIVDPEYYDHLSQFTWHAAKGPRTWYAVHSLTNGKTAPRKNLRMHRAVMSLSNGHIMQDKLSSSTHPPRGPGAERRASHLFIDHINHNGLDNRCANLRIATFTQNVRHRRKFKLYSRSKFKGVDWVQKQKKWRARILVDGRRIYLGSFHSEIAAAHAYDKAARKHHGQFASLNFPDDA